MLSRRMPSPTPPLTYSPSSSGPRCVIAPHIARSSVSATGAPSQRMIPAMPHMVRCLGSGVATAPRSGAPARPAPPACPPARRRHRRVDRRVDRRGRRGARRAAGAAARGRTTAPARRRPARTPPSRPAPSRAAPRSRRTPISRAMRPIAMARVAAVAASIASAAPGSPNARRHHPMSTTTIVRRRTFRPRRNRVCARARSTASTHGTAKRSAQVHSWKTGTLARYCRVNSTLMTSGASATRKTTSGKITTREPAGGVVPERQRPRRSDRARRRPSPPSSRWRWTSSAPRPAESAGSRPRRSAKMAGSNRAATT